jgi:branched-chain amino acid transport system substrate-binding protein
MQRKIIIAITLVIIIAVAAVAGVYTVYFAPSGESRAIVVGLVAPVSGSPIGVDMQRAAQLAVQEINDAGGVYVSSWRTHVNITLVTADTKGDAPADALAAVTQLWNTNPVDLFIGGYGSAGTLADEKVAMDNRVPFIITGASNNLVTRRGSQGDYGGYGTSGTYSTTDSEGMSYMFHYCTTTYDYAKTVVDFFNSTMKPMVAPGRNFSLALLYRYDAFGQSVAAATKYWIQAEGLPITVVAEEHYTPGDATAQATALSGIKAANPDAVFVAENPDKSPGLIEMGWNTVGLKTVYVSVENNQDPQFYSLFANASVADGQLMESKMDPFMVPSYSSAVETYSAKFNAAYGVMPGMMGADTYDAFYIAKAAIESAGTVDKAAVRDAIAGITLDQSLILMENGKIQFTTGNATTSSIGISYHEIKPVTFMEQLKYNSGTGKLQSVIIWPSTAGGISNFNQTTFTLPTGYVAGS